MTKNYFQISTHIMLITGYDFQRHSQKKVRAHLLHYVAFLTYGANVEMNDINYEGKWVSALLVRKKTKLHRICKKNLN